MLFNLYQGTTIQTHRTGLTSIANVDTYLRALTPDYGCYAFGITLEKGILYPYLCVCVS